MAAPRKSAALLAARAKKRAGKERTAPRGAHSVKVAPGSPLAPERIQGILQGLATAYPDAHCALIHKSAWELLVATILSAQCTDVRVNKVTPDLFRQFPKISDLAALEPEELEPVIRTTGFFRNKAKSVVGAARRIMDTFHGRVPDTMDDLLSLPGVARKTANVVLGVWFQQAQGVVVDTHVQRVSQRLKLTLNVAPEKIEKDLMAILPRERWIAFSHEVIWHGRQTCVARKPKCAACNIEKLCYSSDKTYSSV